MYAYKGPRGARALGKSPFFLTKSLLPREFPKKFWCRGGGLFFFAPKSFVGKHFIGQIQLRAFLEAKRGRWVYERADLV
jgi:hypothetical protein